MQRDTDRYAESLRRYAEQWTNVQIREAIADEQRILGGQSLSDVAHANSSFICGIYQKVLEERESDSAA